MELPYRSCEISQWQIGRVVGGLAYAAGSEARWRFTRDWATMIICGEKLEEIHNSLG
jgi:hypothetical protein